ncbi:MAG TPA: hypothetical protein VFO18_11635 [Methylomirabilota bacterium]|nr:hypothetical protein [Methylomirabilota bacterium]
MTSGDPVLAEYVEKLFTKASLLTLAVMGHSRFIEDRGLSPDSSYLSQLEHLAGEVEFGLGMIHDRLTERKNLAL